MNSNLLWLLTFALVVSLAVGLGVLFFIAAKSFRTIDSLTSKLPKTDEHLALDPWSQFMSLPVAGALAILVPQSSSNAPFAWALAGLLFDALSLRNPSSHPKSSAGWQLLGFGALLRASAWALAALITLKVHAALS